MDKADRVKGLTSFLGALGSVPLDEVRAYHVTDWVLTLKLGRRGKPVCARTISRRAKATGAAVRFAIKKLGFVGDRSAWSIEQERAEGETEEINPHQFLRPEQRQAVIDAASPAFGAFYRALYAIGCRPGELARVVVADVDLKALTVRLTSSKGAGRTSMRLASIPAAEREFLRQQVDRARFGRSLVFLDPHGRQWVGANGWCREWDRAKRAADAAGAEIGARAMCYSARHSRSSELLQRGGLDAILVVKLCGNSPDVILKHYLHLDSEAIQRKLANL